MRMSKQEKKGLEPGLRFSEFRYGPGWEHVHVSDILAVRDERRPPSTDAPLFSLTIENGVTAKSDRYNREFLVADPGKKKYKLVRPMDIVYNPSNLRWGAINYSRLAHPVVVSPIYEVLYVTDKAAAVFDFVARALMRPEQISRFITKGQGTLVERIAVKIEFFLGTLLSVPPNIAEQQKIADCLTSVDELITSQTQKLNALKAHKKGLMQQLFPAEGETVPRLRFANEGDWTVASLPEVVFFQEGPGIMAVDFRSEGVPLVRLAGVSGTAVTLDGCNYLDPEKVGQKWAHFRLELNDLIISTSATFGLTSIVTDAAVGAVFYTGLIRFRPSSGRLDLGYLKAFLGSPHFARQAESAAVGGGIKHFGPTHLKQMEIPVAPLAEQQRIADCLTSIDELITNQAQKVEALNAHKKGLMQQLFPAMDEVDA